MCSNITGHDSAIADGGALLRMVTVHLYIQHSNSTDVLQLSAQALLHGDFCVYI